MKRNKILLKILILIVAFIWSASLVGQSCTATFNYSVGSNGVVTFTSNAVGTSSNNTLYWFFTSGSPASSTISNPVVTFPGPGTYTVYHSMFMSSPNFTCSSSQVIVIVPTCSASIAYTAASTATTCDGKALVTSNVCNPASYTWAPPPGSVAGPAAGGLCPGTVYTVQISAGSSGACCPFITQTVSVPFCALNASFTSVPGPKGAINFINQSSGLGSNPLYFWKFGDGNTSSAASPSHTYAANGNYFATLYINAGSNCLDSITVPINVNTYTCSANFTFSMFPNGYVQFTNTSQPTSTTSVVSFSFGNGNSISGAGIYTAGTTYTSNGNYTVTLNVSVNGCISSTTFIVPVVNIPLPCQLQAAFQYTIVSDSIVNLWSTSTGTTLNSVYSWTFSNGSMTNGPTPTETFSAPGTYTVHLMVTDSFCNSLDTGIIIVPSFSCNLVPSFGHTVGTQGNVTFSSTSLVSGSNVTYQWFFGDGTGGTGKNTFHSYTNAGSHLVKLIVTSGNCKDSTILSVNITGISCNANSNFTLIPTGTMHYWYAIPSYPWNVVAAKWSWGDGSTSDSLYASHQYSVSSTYSICLSVTVSCGGTSTTCAPYYVYRSSQTPNTVYYVNVIPPDFKILGVNDHNKDSDFEIFPNPNNGEFLVKWSSSNSDPVTIKLFNLMGSTVFVSELLHNDGNGILLNTGDLPQGVYFVELMHNDTKILKKIIVNR